MLWQGLVLIAAVWVVLMVMSAIAGLLGRWPEQEEERERRNRWLKNRKREE